MITRRRDRHNILRPEALESLYYLYWITREDVYRDQAWAIFEAFEEHCRVDRGGYAGLEDVTDVSTPFPIPAPPQRGPPLTLSLSPRVLFCQGPWAS